MSGRSKSNKAIVRSFIEEVWSAGKTDRVAEYVASDYAAHALRSEVDIVGIEGSTNNARTTRERYPNLRVDIHDLIADGDRVVCYLALVSRSHDDAPERVKKEMVVFKLRESKLIECWSIGTDWRKHRER